MTGSGQEAKATDGVGRRIRKIIACPRHTHYHRDMPRDYAKPRRQPDKQTYTLFHAPSFAFGILFGMALVFAGAYGPEWLEKDKPPVVVAEKEPEKPQLKFEFPKLLTENEVQVDPKTYAPPGSLDTPPPEPEKPKEFMIQAGSFRSVVEAENVRAALLLQDLPVSMGAVELPDGTWYRVVVGPYSDRVKAQSEVDKLREQHFNVILQEKTG